MPSGRHRDGLDGQALNVRRGDAKLARVDLARLRGEVGGGVREARLDHKLQVGDPLGRALPVITRVAFTMITSAAASRSAGTTQYRGTSDSHPPPGAFCWRRSARRAEQV